MTHTYPLFYFSLMMFVACTPATEQGNGHLVVENISPERLEQMAEEGVRIIDVRTPEETATGIIKYAELIDYYGPNFEWTIGQLDRSLPVVVYCASGSRSAKAAKIMLEAGFWHVYTLEGGVDAWKTAGYEISIP